MALPLGLPGSDESPWWLEGAQYQTPTQALDPNEIAALRQRNAVRPPLGRQEGAATQFVEDTFGLPKTPLDAAAMFALGGPAGRVGTKALALGLGGLLSSGGEAEAGPLAAVKKAIKAYHGSPHDFDKFDLSKIGTGEGAQAYGHGLYFAENPATAQTYKDAMRVTDMNWPVKGTEYDLPAWVARTAQNSPRALDEVRQNFVGRVEEARRELAAGDHNASTRLYHTQRVVDALDAVKGGAELQKPGKMYEVNINADPAHFLDWDKYLSQQSEHVRDALGYKDRASNAAKLAQMDAEVAAIQKQIKPPDTSLPFEDLYASLFKETPETRALGELVTQRNKLREEIARGSDPSRNFTGEQIIRGETTSGRASDPAKREMLVEKGIPGIKYLDQGSRGAKEGTSNYVLFRDDIIDILRKYGLAGAAPAGGLALSVPSGDQAEAAGLGPLWHGISKVKLPRPIAEMTATHVPTAPITEKTIAPEALQGGLLLPAWGDRSIAGTSLTEVGGQKLANPVEMQGGHGFMPANVGEGVAWASGKPVIGRLATQTRKLAEGGDPVYFPYTAMGERSVDFSHHVSDTLAEMFKGKSVPTKTVADFNTGMKTADVNFPAIEDWPGLRSPKLKEYLATASGDVRNKFAKLMDTREFQAGGMPSVAEARFAITDPSLLDVPTGAAGRSIARLDPEGRVVTAPTTPHRTYSTQLGGQYVGGLPLSIPKEVMYPDMVAALEKMGYPAFRNDYLMQRGVTGAPIAQRADQQWVDRISKFIEQARSQGQ